MNVAQVEYAEKIAHKNRVLEKKRKQQNYADGITIESSSNKNPILLIIIVSFIVFSIALLYGYLNIAQQNRNINTLSSEIRSLKATKDTYSIKLEPHKSIERISKLAKFNYNMDFPSKEQVKYLDKLR